MRVVIAMEKAVEQHLDPAVGPVPQSRRERGSGNDRAVTPMVRHNQHREAIADPTTQEIAQLIDRAFETRRYVMD